MSFSIFETVSNNTRPALSDIGSFFDVNQTVTIATNHCFNCQIKAAIMNRSFKIKFWPERTDSFSSSYICVCFGFGSSIENNLIGNLNLPCFSKKVKNVWAKTWKHANSEVQMNSFRKESRSGISSRPASVFLTQEMLSLVTLNYLRSRILYFSGFRFFIGF